MRALWNGVVVAEADDDTLIRIEGNWYFPPDSLKRELFSDSDHHTVCFWKGDASYYNINVGDKTNEFGAWYYHTPKEGSIERVGEDFTDYVAFWNGVEIS